MSKTKTIAGILRGYEDFKRVITNILHGLQTRMYI